MPGLKAITFDVWETLVTNPAGADDHRHALRSSRMAAVLSTAGFRFTAADVSRAIHDSAPVIEDEVWSLDRDLDTVDQVRYALSSLDARLLESIDVNTLAALDAAFGDVSLDVPPRLIDGVGDVLAACADSGLRLGIICNTGRTPGRALRSIFESQGILDRFDAATFSNEARLRKPRREVFEMTLKELGVTADCALHVGDDALTDIAGSKAVGMRAIHISSGVRRTVTVPPDATIVTISELPDTLRSLGCLRPNGSMA